MRWIWRPATTRWNRVAFSTVIMPRFSLSRGTGVWPVRLGVVGWFLGLTIRWLSLP